MVRGIMPRRIAITKPSPGMTLQVTLTYSIDTLRSSGVMVAGGASNKTDGITSVVVLLQNERDKSRAIQVLAKIGIEAKSVL